MNEIVGKSRSGLRKTIEGRVLEALRESKDVSDREIDAIRLAKACGIALDQVRDFDDPELPSLSPA